MPDTDSYLVLGRHIANGEPYEYGGPDSRIFRAPGYPLVLAALFRVAGTEVSLVGARVLGALLGTLAVAGVMWLGTTIFRDRQEEHDSGPSPTLVAGTAGVLATFYPVRLR